MTNADTTAESDSLDAEIEAFKKDVDRTLLRENLKLTVEGRLRQLIEQARLADQFDSAARIGKRR
jgi:hypothetical protein